MKKDAKGFTLMEMLIVVAIISILVAVSIPIFASQLEKAREATCMANRRGLKALLTAAWIMDVDKEEVFQTYTANTSGGKEFTCPSKGKINYLLNSDTGVISVFCTKHSRRGADNVLEIAASNIENLFRNKNNTGDIFSIDSNANGGAERTKLVNDWLAANHLDLADDDAATWKITKSKDGKTISYIWSSYDASNYKDNTQIPAIAYSNGKYYVGLTNVNSQTLTNPQGTKYSYIASGAENRSGVKLLNGNSTAHVFDTRKEAEVYYATLQPSS